MDGKFSKGRRGFLQSLEYGHCARLITFKEVNFRPKPFKFHAY